jgi:hypothetical protein
MRHPSLRWAYPEKVAVAVAEDGVADQKVFAAVVEVVAALGVADPIRYQNLFVD